MTEDWADFAYKFDPYGYNDLIEETRFGALKDSQFAKADDPLLISTTGAWRAIMGKLAWYFVNYDNPTFGCLRKVAWDKSGERIVTADPGTAATQGVVESGALPDAQKPTMAYHATQFKQVVTRFQISRKQRRAAELGDDAVSFEELRNWAVQHNALNINKMILEDVATGASASAGAYTGKDGFECLDRIISSDGEEDDNGGGGSGWYDPWTKYEAAAGGTVWDRDAGTTYDAVVYHADGTISSGNPDFTSDDPLSLEVIEKLIDATQDNGAKRQFQVFITSRNTARIWSQLVSPKQRFDDYQEVEFTVNGVQTVSGRKAGFKVAMYDGIPIIVDDNDNVPEDGTGRILSLIHI